MIFIDNLLLSLGSCWFFLVLFFAFIITVIMYGDKIVKYNDDDFKEAKSANVYLFFLISLFISVIFISAILTIFDLILK